MSVKEYDLLVVGGGPAGFWASLVGAINGLKTALVEEVRVGGTCLNSGCVPLVTALNYLSAIRLVKRLAEEGSGVKLEGLTADLIGILRSVRARVINELSNNMSDTLESLGIDVVNEKAYLTGSDTAKVGDDLIRFKKVVIATGLTWGAIKGARPSTSLLDMDKIPNSVLVIGGNAFGISVASLLSLAGSEVMLVDSSSKLLVDFDREVAEYVTMMLLEGGLKIFTDTSVASIEMKEGVKEVRMVNPDGQLVGVFDEVIDASTYNPRLDVFRGVNVRLRNGYVDVDEYLRTSIPNMYAAGDVTGVLPYAHVAIVQGIVAGANASGSNLKVNYKVIPKYLFAYPEAFSVGLTEEEAKNQGYEVVVARQKLSSNSIVKASGGEGMIKVVLDPNYGVLGIHCVGTNISELVNEATLALTLESTPEAILTTFLAHPTIGEALREALIQAVKLRT